MGVTRADGRSLLKWDHGQPPADDLPSFTLGSVNVSPMSMAAAYATVAARGHVLHADRRGSGSSPATGARLPVAKAHCHQAIPAGVADAANYILQSVLTVGTAAGLGIGRPAAGKTGTSDNFDFAAFGGYTPDLAGLRVGVQPASTRSSSRCRAPGLLLPATAARARCSAPTRPRTPGR